jgi:hypothetical protein
MLFQRHLNLLGSVFVGVVKTFLKMLSVFGMDSNLAVRKETAGRATAPNSSLGFLFAY